MKKLNKNDLVDMDSNQTIIVVSIVAVVILAFGLAFSSKLFGDLMFKREIYTQKSEARDTLDENLEKSEELSENFSLLAQSGISEDQVLKAVPAELNFSEQATTLENIAIRSGVALTSVSVEQDVNQPIVPNPQDKASQDSSEQKFKVMVEVTGDYRGFIKFIESIENSIRPYEIVRSDVSGESGVVIGEVHLNTYYVPYINPEPTIKEVSE